MMILTPVYDWARQLVDEFSKRTRKSEPVLSPHAGELQKDTAEADALINEVSKDLEAERRNHAGLQKQYQESTNRDRMARLDSEMRVSLTISERLQRQLQEYQARRASLASELSTIQAQHAAAVADYELSRSIDVAKDEITEIDEGIRKALIRRREICFEFGYTRRNAARDRPTQKRCEDFANQCTTIFEIGVLSQTVGKIRATAGAAAIFRHFFAVETLEPKL